MESLLRNMLLPKFIRVLDENDDMVINVNEISSIAVTSEETFSITLVGGENFEFYRTAQPSYESLVKLLTQ